MHTLTVQLDDAVITDLKKTAQQEARSVDELVQEILQKHLQPTPAENKLEAIQQRFASIPKEINLADELISDRRLEALRK